MERSLNASYASVTQLVVTINFSALQRCSIDIPVLQIKPWIASDPVIALYLSKGQLVSVEN